jgi:ABC-2 type transport system ATP-binding protein
MSAIQVQGLHKAFGRVVAVESVSFAVQPGEFVGLVGPNGAGKSTTIKVLAGQLTPTRGTIHVGGVDVVQDPGGARAKLGYVPEEAQLYEYLSAREMLEFVAELRGGGDIAAALELTGLGTDAERLIREYSQGMRRKTALAAALLAEPEVLILDESLNGLDPPSAARVIAALRAACDRGAAVLLSTHVLDTLEKLADRVVMLRDGAVIADAPATELSSLRELYT